MTPSGLRVGSPSVTTQGMTETDMAEVGALLARAVKAEHGTPAGDAELAAVADEVSALVARAPRLPAGLTPSCHRAASWSSRSGSTCWPG